MIVRCGFGDTRGNSVKIGSGSSSGVVELRWWYPPGDCGDGGSDGGGTDGEKLPSRCPFWLVVLIGKTNHYIHLKFDSWICIQTKFDPNWMKIG